MRKPVFDLKQTFSAVLTVSGLRIPGQWTLEPESGMFKQSFAVDYDTGCIVPMSAIECLIPDGSCLPSELPPYREAIQDEISEECSRG